MAAQRTMPMMHCRCGLLLSALWIATVGCHSVDSRRARVEDVGQQRVWDRGVYYALPETRLHISVPVIEVRSKAGSFCAKAEKYETVVQPPEKKGFCDKYKDHPLVEYEVKSPRIHAARRTDRAQIYYVGRLPVLSRLDVEEAIARHGLIGGSSILRSEEAPPVSTGASETETSSSFWGGSLRAANAESAVLLIDRLQESRLAMVTGYGREAQTIDRETLQLMIAETDRAIADLNALFVEVERKTRWIPMSITPRPSDFAERPGTEGCAGGSSATRATYPLGRFDEASGFRNTANASGEGSRVCVTIELFSQIESGIEPERTDRVAGLYYREAPKAELSVLVGGAVYAQEILPIPQLGPISLITQARLAEEQRSR